MTMLIRIFTLFGFLALTLLSSCNTDPCEDVVCQNEGICINGTCDCDDFHTGTFCQKEVREDVTGVYTGAFTWDGDTYNISVQIITKGDNPQNLDSSFGSMELMDANRFNIPFQQLILDGYAYFVEGQGSFNGNQVIMNFYLNEDGDVYPCSFIGTK